MTEIIVAVVITALGSSLATSLGFISAYNSKLTGLKKDVASLMNDMLEVKSDLKDIRAGKFSCLLHADTLEVLGRYDERIKTLEKHV